MGLRAKLNAILKTALGSNYVYYQPPSDVILQYPCIIYSRTKGNTKFADNNPYSHRICYQIIVIDRDPDSPIPDRVAMLPMCVFDRPYTANNLYHNVYNIYV